MNRKMKAAVLTELETIEIKEMDIPSPKDDEVLIKVKSIGICGSDVHYYEEGRIGSFVVEKPIILGHECAGEIVAVGKNVNHLSEGDRVAIEPGVTCGTCEHCKQGQYNLCPDVKFLATPPFDGAFCEYLAIRADVVFKIPQEMTYDEAAMIEPLSVGLHAVERGKLRAGETVVIMGMGPIGLLAATAAKFYGAHQIIGVDFERKRLDVAKQMGATHTICLQDEDVIERINEITMGQGTDLALETAGNEKALQSAIDSVKRSGRVVVVGMPPGDLAALNINDIVGKEIDLYGVFRYVNTYKKAINLIATNDIDLHTIITDYYSLDQVGEAFKKVTKDKENTVKVIIQP